MIVVFDASDGRTVCEFRGDETSVVELACASDGLLYSLDWGGIVRCWNLEDQREPWRLLTHHQLFQ